MARRLLVVALGLSISGPVFANTTKYWLGRRSAALSTVWDDGVIPTRHTPDYGPTMTNVTGLSRLVWDLHGQYFPLNSTVYQMPRQPPRLSRTVFLLHHGHATGPDAPGATWWDFYNCSAWLHSLGYDYFMMYMPLLGPNQQHGYPPSHQWFEQWEQKGDK
eukprot:gene5069-5172_t